MGEQSLLCETGIWSLVSGTGIQILQVVIDLRMISFMTILRPQISGHDCIVSGITSVSAGNKKLRKW